eukprot:CAMPEP_0198298016 /NCGR_PEP_ID=MMETSP1449-20131203/39304_1 /TAXON_ID=420275 /ORGANISM="Attheya septentrionalis, Strain CCMP2084" /LENGTH=444 /DNA_ID=CAMNT_0043999167 /DNA_START=237 /DNA_END=1571 /DNA_ORIENTATION=-
MANTDNDISPSKVVEEQATPKPTPNYFYTTSDLMDTMNEAMKGTGGDPDTGPQVELQKRMPDGSTVRADEKDMAVANLQSKVKQCAMMVKDMTQTQKIEWAKQQRVEGNILFGVGEYQEAMDVYLTCLVAMDTTTSKKQSGDKSLESKVTPNVENQTSRSSETSIATTAEKEIQLPVLLNLSLCALKLGMLKKAEAFTNFALELPSGAHDPKVYFRRGKARMRMGCYKEARADMEHALQLLSDESSSSPNDDTNNTAETTSLQNNCSEQEEAVRKDLRKLTLLEKEAQRNRKRHETAMKVALGGNKSNKGISLSERVVEPSVGASHCLDSTDGIGNAATSVDTLRGSENHAISQSSHDDDGLYRDVRQRRLYSTLTADRSPPHEEDEIIIPPSYFQMYLSMVVRVLEKTLEYLGDGEPDKETKHMDHDTRRQSKDELPDTKKAL